MRLNGSRPLGRATTRAALAATLLVATVESQEVAAGGVHRCAAAVTRCEGTVRVPLDRGAARSDSIDVAFVWLPRTDATRPARGTILANFGGPAAAIPFATRLRDILGPTLERDNLLVVDPRGLGRSSPLRCLPVALSDFAGVAACARALGPSVRFYASDQVAADIEAVRSALGIETVTLYGNSYGTVFLHAYLARYPDRVDAAFFDSMVLVGDDGYVRHPMRRGPDVVEFVCQRSVPCRAREESPSTLLERLTWRLRVRPDSAVPIRALPSLLQGANVSGVREVAAAAAAYLAGDRHPLHRLTRGFGSFTDVPLEDAGGLLAIVCADARFPYERAASSNRRRQQLRRYEASARPWRPFARADFTDILGFVDPCLHWPTPRASPPVPPDASYPAIPILVASGDFDTRRPDEVARFLRRFPRATLLRVPFGGHALAAGPAPHNGCVRAVMRAFLEERGRVAEPRDASVACDAESFRALGTFPRRSADLPEPEGDDLDPSARRLVAAVFATVQDAVARRDPLDRARGARAGAEPGLRGGTVAWDPSTRTLTMVAARFVEDVTVAGTVRLDAKGEARADATAAVAAREHHVRFDWRAFVAEDVTAVTGRVDGQPFRVRIPAH